MIDRNVPGVFLMPRRDSTDTRMAAELSMLLEGITPLRVNQRYQIG